MRRSLPRSLVILLVAMMSVGSLLAPSASLAAQDAATPEAVLSDASPVAEAESGPVDLDVLFVGAHPDDEASRLSTYGQWEEYEGLEVGVITITRGEGGGNAVGTEEGPALGLIREQEERAAVGLAGIEHIYYLDKVDFYYNLSAPLTEEVWGHDDTLERVVRVVRSTTPEVIVTMNPSPSTHGHHQMAARLAVEAYQVAGDPSIYPHQIEEEDLPAWAPGKVFTTSFSGEQLETGESCETAFTQDEPTDVAYGVWAGRTSEANNGETWAQIEQEARQMYASQGWAGFPDAPENPDEIGCDFFTLIDSRSPYTLGNSEPTAVLEGAVLPTTGGLPAGTLFELESTQFEVVAGEPFEVEVAAEAADAQAGNISVSYELPEGWTSEVVDSTVDESRLDETVAITPPEDAERATRYQLVATLDIDGATGQNAEVVEVRPAVEGHVEPLPLVAEFREWLDEAQAPVLDSLIKPIVIIGVGETRDIEIDVTNNTAEEQNAAVTILLDAGFTVENDTQPLTLGPNESTTVTFSVTNEDTSLPTANEGGLEGDYLLDIRTVAAGESTTEQAGINLVPVTTVPPIGGTPAADAAGATPVASPVAAAPTVDGTINSDEYAIEPLDLSRVWEGEDPESAEDASGSAWLAWDENGLYVAVEAIDDEKGTVLPQEDAKRHWRTDSVEIAIDPLGNAEDTSATFKVGVFPETEEGGPAAYRDADAYQGPVSETAPGFEVASSVSDPYTGYTLETFIPFDVLPAPVDPDNMTMNIFIYDSDTQDLTGQTRLGWSTWGGVQGTPYRWGHVHLAGFPDSDGGEVEEAQMPLDVAQSVDSPWSIIQSAEDGVPLAASPQVQPGSEVTVISGPSIEDGTLTASVEAGDASGELHAFAVSNGDVLGDQVATVEAGDVVDVTVDLDGDAATDVTFALSFQTDDGAVQAIASDVEP